MDKIWDRKSFEVGGHCRCGGDEKKTNDRAEPTKVERLKLKATVSSGSSVFIVLLVFLISAYSQTHLP